jgi:hypothetical protein
MSSFIHRFNRLWRGHNLRSRIQSTRSAVGQRFRRLSSPVARRKFCDDICQWASVQPDAHCAQLSEPIVITRRLPETVDPEVHPFFLIHQTQTINAKSLVKIARAHLWGWNGFIVLPDGKYVAEIGYSRELVARERAFRFDLPKRRVKMPGRYYSLITAWWLNYFHWTNDSLLGLFRVLERLPNDIQFIIPPDRAPFHLPTLKALGIPSDRIVRYDLAELWELEELWFSPSIHYFHSKQSYEWLRTRILASVSLTTDTSFPRIYISRRDAGHRRIVNEAEIEAYLTRLNFKTVQLEYMSFENQVALFANAHVVISSHGAGFTNLIYAPDSTCVIEIFEPSFVSGASWGIASILGQQYWCVLGETISNPGSAPDLGREVPDIYLPLEKLAQTLARAGIQ